MAVNKNIEMYNAKLKYKNFSGKPSPFDQGRDPKGIRSFNVILEEDFAKQLIKDGWNVRVREPKEEGMPVTYDLKVKVRFDVYPPTVVLISSKGKTVLTEDNIGMLDWADTANIDLSIRPYNWENARGSGTTAYLQSMAVTIEEDPILAANGFYDIQE